MRADHLLLLIRRVLYAVRSFEPSSIVAFRSAKVAISRTFGERKATLLFCLLLSIACITVSGCLSGSEATSEPQASLSENGDDSQPDDFRLAVASEAVRGEYPIVVHDLLGRSIRLEKRPRRIVSLTPSTTEVLFAIGAGPQIVGATQHCNYPPEATAVPRVGAGTLESISREELFDRQPDLVLCKWDNHEPLIDTLDDFGIPALGLGPETLDDLYLEISVLGRVTGCEANAEQLVSQMKRRVEALTTLTEAIPSEDRRSVFYQVWDEPLMTAGPASFIGELLELAGTENIFADTATRYPRISDEAVVARNPDVILAPSTHATKVERAKILERQGWDQVTAVRKEQIFLIDGDKVSRCGPRLVDALDEIIRVVYPDQYETMRPPTESSAIEDDTR